MSEPKRIDLMKVLTKSLREVAASRPSGGEPPYLQSCEFGGFDYGDIQAAYIAGAKSGRDHQPSDELIERAADAYVKSVAPIRSAALPEPAAREESAQIAARLRRARDAHCPFALALTDGVNLFCRCRPTIQTRCLRPRFDDAEALLSQHDALTARLVTAEVAIARLRSFARHFLPPQGAGAYYLSADDPVCENAGLLLEVLDDYETLVRNRSSLPPLPPQNDRQPEALHAL